MKISLAKTIGKDHVAAFAPFYKDGKYNIVKVKIKKNNFKN
jgi:hypothetical protein